MIFAEEGSELDDVGNEVFAEDDVAYEGAVVIYQEKNISGLLRADFDTSDQNWCSVAAGCHSLHSCH